MKLAALVLFISAFAFVSCKYMGGKRVRGNGNASTEERQMGSFNGVRVRGGIDVFVAPGNNSLKIEADQNLLSYIEVRNNGGVIEVQSRHGYNLNPVSGIKVYATAPSFSVIEVAGSGDIKSQAKITGTDHLNVEIKGSGDVQLDVDAPKVEADIAGSGDIKLNGRTKDFNANIRGSGDISSYNLLSENTRVDIAGNGDAEVFASKLLDVEIKGSGEVRYKGTPSINQKIMGSGSIKQVQ